MNSKKGITFSIAAIAAVTLVFAATPLIVAYVQSHEAQAFFMGGFHNRGFFGFHRHFGFGFNRPFFGGFGGWGGCGGCGGWGW